MDIKRLQGYKATRPQGLIGKKVLITAGPTWVPIDSVRVISNISTGQTGILLAQRLQGLGAKVTLILGPVECCCLDRGIKIIRFRFFGELKEIIRQALSAKKYDIFIHSAAVSDYRLKKQYADKIKSGRNNLKLLLTPTEKIINSVKKMQRGIFLVGFKFEPGARKYELIKSTNLLIKRAHLDLAVANTISGGHYQAFLLTRNKINGPLFSKEILVRALVHSIIQFN
ncbi:MAG: phosphopantothenoylcysteine decarboxylase [Candidatus Omnitrophota bacterium]